jgi:hypothetical protein
MPPNDAEVSAMADEFDDIDVPVQRHAARTFERDATARPRFPVERLVSRVYRSASGPLRAKLLMCLLRPLGTLGLVAVASGAFGRFLHRDRAVPDASAVESAAHYSGDQVLELARFVQEVNPEALEQLAGLLADNAMGLAALSASALVLVYRRYRPASAPSSPVTRLPDKAADARYPETPSGR